jgi:thiamine pyrophosphokinase
MHFLIFSGGELNPGLAVRKALSDFDKILAVDSGAAHSEKFKLKPDFLVGDFDSIDKKVLDRLKAGKTKILQFPKEKKQTDTELGIKTAVEYGATEITILGGTAGDRVDHILANVLLSTQFTIPIKFTDSNSITWLAKGPKTEKINGGVHDLLSLIPLSQVVKGIQTEGLKYPLKNESLIFGKSRGISNEFLKKTINVKWAYGILVISHTLNK